MVDLCIVTSIELYLLFIFSVYEKNHWIRGTAEWEKWDTKPNGGPRHSKQKHKKKMKTTKTQKTTN